jgi:hypothetical protein
MNHEDNVFKRIAETDEYKEYAKEQAPKKKLTSMSWNIGDNAYMKFSVDGLCIGRGGKNVDFTFEEAKIIKEIFRDTNYIFAQK